MKDHLTPAHLKSDAAWRMALDDVPGDGDNPGIRHPDTGQGEVRHVQQGVPGDHVLPPPAVQVLGKESKNIFDRVYTKIFPIMFIFPGSLLKTLLCCLLTQTTKSLTFDFFILLC